MSHPFLQTTPHLLLDLTGRMVSCFELDQAKGFEPRDLKNLAGASLGTIHCSPAHWPLFEFFFRDETPAFSLVKERSISASKEIVSKDLESVLFQAAHVGLSLDDALYSMIVSLRSFLDVENCSVFGVHDDSGLEGLVAVTPFGRKNRASDWNTSSMNIAGIVSQEKKGYVSADPSLDSNFQKQEGLNVPKNLACFPILNSGELVGIINLSNKLSGPFEDKDLRMIQRFADVMSHLIKAEFEKEKSKKYLNTSANLGKYLSKNRVRQIASQGTSGELGGEKRKVVALFSDIRGFSTISETLPADVLVSLLNFYFEEMSAVIEAHHGTLDKLVGDLMMVLWNIPNEQKDPEILALKAAIEMQKAIYRRVIPKWREAGVENFGVGIGINAGEAIAGNIGSKHFMNYTVIGNTINTAQRLEARAKAGEIWVHQSMWPVLEGKVIQPARIEKNLQLKGLSQGVNAYVFWAPK